MALSEKEFLEGSTPDRPVSAVPPASASRLSEKEFLEGSTPDQSQQSAPSQQPAPQEGLFTEAGRRLVEGGTKIGRAFQPNSGVQNILGIPGSGRVGSAVSGMGETIGALTAPVGYVAGRVTEPLARRSGNLTDESLQRRRGELVVMSPRQRNLLDDPQELEHVTQLLQMPYEARIARAGQLAGVAAEIATPLPAGRSILRAPGNIVRRLRGVGAAARPVEEVAGAVRPLPAGLTPRLDPSAIVKQAEAELGPGASAERIEARINELNRVPKLATAGPLKLQAPLAEAARGVTEGVAGQTLRTGGARIETAPVAQRPAGAQQLLDEAERLTTGGGRGTQRTLEAAQDFQTGRRPLDLGEAGKRMAAQRGTYQPTAVQETERQFVRQLEQEIAAPVRPAVPSSVVPERAVAAQGPLRAVEAPQRGPASALRETFAPSSLSKETGETASVIRTRLGELARERAVTAHLFKGVEQTFDRMPVPQRIEFIGRMEHGAAQSGAALNDTAAALRKTLDEKWAEVVKHNPKAAEDYIQNYFPHLWENEAAAGRVYGLQQATVEGAKGFLKERNIPTVKVGLDAGLKLKDDNPARLVAQRLNDMDRYIAGQRVIEDLKSRGLARAFKDGEAVPSGWQRMPDTVPNAHGLYVPQDVALIVDRWLKPGLSGNRLYDTARSVGNSLNQFQLGFSAYHAFFTSMDAMASRMALGFKELATPGMRLRGAKDVVLGVSPTTVWTNAQEGNRVLKAYLHEPGFEKFNHLANAVVKAGGRASMDPFYRTGPLARGHFEQSGMGQFSSGVRRAAERVTEGTKALGAGQVKTAGAQTVRAVGETLNAVSDMVSYPIMQKLVPAQKLGVFSKMAEFEIAKLGPKASELDVTQALQRAWDSVDNRMGQMVYDNLFWNKTFKDSLMLGTRSVGWNAGTIREIGGGVGELAKVPLGRQREFSHKMAYTAAFPIVAGVYGAITQYLMTGKGPTELKDYFAPRTGKVFPDGRPERVLLATYMRDVLAATKGLELSPMAPVKLGENLFTMAKHKVHPIFQATAETSGNEDFYGAAIRDPQDPEIKRFTDSLRFLAEQWTPISVRQMTGMGQAPVKPGFERSYPGLSFVGITPAPAAIERSTTQQAEVQQKIDRMKLSKKRKRERGY